MVDIPKKASNYVFEQPHSLLLDQLSHHVAEHSSHSIESFVGVTNVSKSSVIKKDLLHDKYSNSLA